MIVNLKNTKRRDEIQLGGKAVNLGKLIQNDFGVPKGFVITTEAYSLFLKNSNLVELINNKLSKVNYSNYDTIESCSNEIQEAIKKSTLPLEMVERIKEAYDNLYTTSVAVRSSATAEDMPSASFAGQYDTFLNLKTLGQVTQNIKSCYASLWTSRAIAYRYKNQIPQRGVKIAVIIQEMIPAKSSGVLFTMNPVSMNKKELIIESNYGLGESIVTGQCSPDQFLVKRERQHGTEEFTILDIQIGKKNVAVYPNTLESESGTVLIELTENENKCSSLTNQQIIRLSQIGSQIEELFKAPQDIEWAISQDDKIFILQSRPITSLEPVKLEEVIYWTRGYSDDYWNDPVTPLFFDLLGDPLTNIVSVELNSIMGYKEIDTKLLKLYNGHVYFNLNVLRNRVKYEIPKIFRNEDLLNYFPEGSGLYGKETMKNLPFRIFRRIFSEVRIMLFDPNGSMSKTAPKYYEWSENEFEPFCKEFDLRLDKLSRNGDLLGLANLAYDLDRVMVTHYRLIRYGLAVHNIGMNLMLQYLLTKFLGKEDSLHYYPVLISGLEHKLTETNDNLRYLVSIIQKSPELKSIINEKDSEILYEYISSEKNPTVQAFYKEFEVFLEKFGERGFTREVYYPRWNEEPRYVFDILKTLIKDKDGDHKQIKEKQLKYRETIEKLVEAKIRSQRFGLTKWLLCSKILDSARTYLVFREDQRYNLDRWTYRNRKVYLEIGKIFKQKGKLEKTDDIFFLHRREIQKLLEHSDLEVSSLIKTRRDDFSKYEYTIPPKFLHGSREFDDVFQYDQDSLSFKGIPASQGILTSKIRVINKIEEISSVQMGEILIVPKTDPGWTPVFSKLGGLITETGGILSHGAVVSREYGIPAVSNITNACLLFKTGQVVTINGYNGTVVIKK
ncbi:MAG: PEP/pyruvate-binding domain-containing protein [Promethearchaeota archaeon]